MATITFDGPAKRITIGYSGAITSLTAVEIYSAWKDWVLAGNAQYLPAFAESVGGNDLGGGVALGQYVFLKNDSGWRITGASQDYEVRILGDIYPVDPAITMFVPVSGKTVLFTVQRSVGSTTVSTGGGSGASSQEIAAAVWEQDLDNYAVPGTTGDRMRKMIVNVAGD